MAKKKSALKDDSFLLIPASVIHDPRISTLAEAAIFSLILGFSRKGELMRGGQAFAAEWTMLSSKWAGKTLLSLEQKGLIHRVLLSRKGSMVRYGYYAEGYTWEESSLVTKEVSSLATEEVSSLATEEVSYYTAKEVSSHATGEETSHRKYIGNNNSGNRARAREEKKNRFNNFEQRSYDYGELERLLSQ